MGLYKVFDLGLTSMTDKEERRNSVGEKINDTLIKIAEDYYRTKTIPRPSFMECLNGLVMKYGEYEKSKQYIIDQFNDDYKRLLEAGEGGDKVLPRAVLGVLVPLDFYLPIPEGYWASTSSLSNDEPYLILSSVFHYGFELGNSHIRLSYVVVAICNGNVKKLIKKLGDNIVMSDIYEIAILETNRLIGSFRSLPGRYNRYLHEVTIPGLPSMVDMFSFYRDTKKEVYNIPLFAHQSPLVDCFSLSTIDGDEIKELNALHLNFGHDNFNVLKLLAKLSDAANSFSFGRDSEAIIQIQTFVEYSLGFLYCGCLKAEDPRRTYGECVNLYISREGRNHFSTDREIARFLGYTSDDSYGEFKKLVYKDEYVETCKDERDVLIHNFFSTRKTVIQSKKAIKNAVIYVLKIAEMVAGRIVDKPTQEQIALLIESIKAMSESLEKDWPGYEYKNAK